MNEELEKLRRVATALADAVRRSSSSLYDLERCFPPAIDEVLKIGRSTPDRAKMHGQQAFAVTLLNQLFASATDPKPPEGFVVALLALASFTWDAQNEFYAKWAETRASPTEDVTDGTWARVSLSGQIAEWANEKEERHLVGIQLFEALADAIARSEEVALAEIAKLLESSSSEQESLPAVHMLTLTSLRKCTSIVAGQFSAAGLNMPGMISLWCARGRYSSFAKSLFRSWNWKTDTPFTIQREQQLREPQHLQKALLRVDDGLVKAWAEPHRYPQGLASRSVIDRLSRDLAKDAKDAPKADPSQPNFPDRLMTDNEEYTVGGPTMVLLGKSDFGKSHMLYALAWCVRNHVVKNPLDAPWMLSDSALHVYREHEQEFYKGKLPKTTEAVARFDFTLQLPQHRSEVPMTLIDTAGELQRAGAKETLSPRLPTIKQLREATREATALIVLVNSAELIKRLKGEQLNDKEESDLATLDSELANVVGHSQDGHIDEVVHKPIAIVINKADTILEPATLAWVAAREDGVLGPSISRALLWTGLPGQDRSMATSRLEEAALQTAFSTRGMREQLIMSRVLHDLPNLLQAVQRNTFRYEVFFCAAVPVNLRSNVKPIGVPALWHWIATQLLEPFVAQTESLIDGDLKQLKIHIDAASERLDRLATRIQVLDKRLQCFQGWPMTTKIRKWIDTPRKEMVNDARSLLQEQGIRTGEALRAQEIFRTAEELRKRFTRQNGALTDLRRAFADARIALAKA